MSAAAVLVRSRTARMLVATVACAALSVPLVAAAGIAVLTDGAAGTGCGGGSRSAAGIAAAGEGRAGAGMFAAPLRMAPGRWYEVGATEYGGPGDPSSGEYGAIPDVGQSYLPAHPDSFAELSVLDVNPANGGSFSFADANALGGLPYLTGLRVRRDGRELVLAKRDVGYGQGPGQSIANGEPFRLDVWWQAAQQLGVSKSAVQIQLAPASGAGSLLGQTPATAVAGAAAGEAGEACAGAVGGAGLGPLPLVAGERTQILADGLAAAGRQAPAAVKAMVAAGNRLYGTAYLYGGAHGVSLNTLQPAYDCSSAVSYLLHAAGLLGEMALDSTQLESYGQPGPGRWVSIYANAAHAFIFVGGLRFDTVEATEFDSGPNSGKPGARWRVYPGVPDWSTWVVRHPAGL